MDIVPSTAERDRVNLYMICENELFIRTYILPENLNFGTETSCDEVSYQSISLEASALPSLPCTINIEGLNSSKEIVIDSIGNINL